MVTTNEPVEKPILPSLKHKCNFVVITSPAPDIMMFECLDCKKRRYEVTAETGKYFTKLTN